MFWEEEDFERYLGRLGKTNTALPGFFIPLKQVVRSLVQPRKGLLSKLDAGFDIADAVKQYRESIENTDDYEIEEDIDHVDLWLEDNDCYMLTEDRAGAELVREILIPCVKGLKRERIKIKNAEGQILATEVIAFTYEFEGTVDYFAVKYEVGRRKNTAATRSGEAHEDSDEELLRWSSGPYFHIKDSDDSDMGISRKRFNDWLTKAFWDFYGSSVVEIDFQATYHGDRPIINAENDVKNYIGLGGTLAEVEQVAEDTSLFMEAGFSRSIMLLGPPGVGKTTLTRVINNHLSGRCVILKPSFFRKTNGTGPEILAMLAPNVVVFDDFDRYDVDNRALLQMLEWLPKRLSPVITVATVNDITKFDRAGLRPGRFDELVYVPAPDANGRKIVLDYYLDLYSTDTSKSIVGSDYAQITDYVCKNGAGMTPADIAELVKTLTV